MHSHSSKTEYDQHSKRGSAQHTDSKRGSSTSSTPARSAAGQAGSSSQQRQHHQQPQPQPPQQPKQNRWHRHQQPLQAVPAQPSAGKGFSSSSSHKHLLDRGYIAVTASAHNSSSHHQHHHHHSHQQRQLPSPQTQQSQQQGPPTQLMQQQPHLQQQAQQPQQRYGFPMPMATPSTTAVAPGADTPSSLLLPPASGQQQGAGQQQQQPLQAVPADLDQEKCKRLAEVLLKCGKPADASAWVQAALATDPWNVDLLLLRGRALEAAGNIPGK